MNGHGRGPLIDLLGVAIAMVLAYAGLLMQDGPMVLFAIFLLLLMDPGRRRDR